MNSFQTEYWQRREAKIDRRMREWGMERHIQHSIGNPNNKGLFIMSHLYKYGYTINYYSVEDLKLVEEMIKNKWNKRKLERSIISNANNKKIERL